MIDPYPRYRELLERRGGGRRRAQRAIAGGAVLGRRPARPAGLAQARVDRPGLPRRATSACGRSWPRGAASPRRTRRTLRSVELELLRRVIPEYRGRGRARAGRAVDVAVLPPDPAAAVRHRRLPPDAPALADAARAVPASRGRRRAAATRRGRCTSGSSASGRRDSGRRKARSRTRWCRSSPRRDSAGWRPTRRSSRGRSASRSRAPRDGHRRSARAAVSPVPGRRWRAAGRVRIPRPRPVGPDRLHVTRRGRPTAPPTTSSTGSSAAGRRYAARTGGEEATVFVILDGENAWEHYDGQGRPFLRALYGRLAVPSRGPDGDDGGGVRGRRARRCRRSFPGRGSTATSTSGLATPTITGPGVSWSTPGARSTPRPASTPPAALARAREEMLIAEGSDWFWWYGDDHSSDHDLAFDELFRRHVRNVYRALDQPVPEELFVTNISTRRRPSRVEPPTGFIEPTIDGETTSYFEWVGAGTRGRLGARPARCTRSAERTADRVGRRVRRSTWSICTSGSTGRDRCASRSIEGAGGADQVPQAGWRPGRRPEFDRRTRVAGAPARRAWTDGHLEPARVRGLTRRGRPDRRGADPVCAASACRTSTTRWRSWWR